jgi:ligand-binding SRPBCC domain-containing protein
MKVKKRSGVYELKTSQLIQAPLHEVWDFFSKPENLEKITPEKMSFTVDSDVSNEMKEGDIISYKIKIFPFIKSNWVTEIKSVSTLQFFIDEQRVGPYKVWHHRHTFTTTDKGTLMTDEIHFNPPFKLFSNLLVKYSIQPRLVEIFNYRMNIINQIFNSKLILSKL